MTWHQISVVLDSADVERAELLLKLAGAVSVALADDGDAPVLEPAPGAVELWPRVRLSALFESSVDPQQVAAVLGSSIEAASFSAQALDEQDWIGGWQQQVEPIAFGGGRLRLVPAEQPATADDLRLNMGLAFGTGRHPTTKLCVEWLTATPVTGQRVLDFGCGSGILALAALRLGAAFAWATDNDEQAVLATRRNAELNDLGANLWIGLPAALPEATIDLLLANILAGTLAEFADDFAARQQAGGRIVLSGILAAQAADVIRAYQTHYDSFETEELEGWVRICAVRRE